MNNKPQKISRYYGLRVVSTIYKLLSVLTVLLVLGGIGYISVAAINSPFSDSYDLQIWVPQALGLVIGGGLLAFTFFVLAQLVDVQLSMNNKLRIMLQQNEEVIKAVNASNKLMEAQIQQMDSSLDNQARLLRLQNQQTSPLKAETRAIATDSSA